MTGTQMLYALGTIITVLGAYFTAKLGARANDRKVKVEGEVSSGQLALNIATRLDVEVRELRNWRARVQRWWPLHEDWDDDLVRELHRLDPEAVRRIGPPPRLPLDDEGEQRSSELARLQQRADDERQNRGT